MINNNINLPLIIQKYIIKILCRFIDYNNNQINILDYRENENEIKKLILSISLVNKLFFETLSSNLYTAVDFNYYDDRDQGEVGKWSIIKFENIKNLKLHYNHSGNTFYKIVNGNEVKMSLDQVNEKLEILSKYNSNFKRLIFRNINLGKDGFGNMDKLGLYKCNATENMKVFDLSIDGNSNKEQFRLFQKCIKKTSTLSISNTFDASLIVDSFQNWSNSLDTINILSFQNRSIDIFQLLKPSSLTSISFLNNITSIKAWSYDIHLVDLITILKYSHNLQNLVFPICTNNFIYYLCDNSDKDIKFKPCRCYSFRQSNIFGKPPPPDIRTTFYEFQNNWDTLALLFKENKTLKSLQLNFICSSFGNQVKNDQNERALPSKIFENFSRLFHSNKSIESITLISNLALRISKQLLLSAAVLNSSGGNSIKYYETKTTLFEGEESLYDKQKKQVEIDLVNEINEILSNISSPITFKYTQRILNSKFRTITENILINKN